MEKSFDLGIYTFSRTVGVSLCPEDDKQMSNGNLIAVLHPLTKVDPDNKYCFGVDQKSGATKTLMRQNLKFRKVITLKFKSEVTMSLVDELHEKLNTARKFIQEQPNQLSI